MIETTITNPKKSDPVLLDRIIQAMQGQLSRKLPWLDQAFGRAYRLDSVDTESGLLVNYPAVYNGNFEYMSVLPNDNIGNFSWIDIYDPQKVDMTIRERPKLTVDGAVIFWYRQNTVYDTDESMLYREEIKKEILDALLEPGYFEQGLTLTVNQVYDRAENIYQGYSVRLIDSKYFMAPYGAVRIEFTVSSRQRCRG